MEKVSLILPMYNEEKLILKTLENLESYFKSKKYDYELVVVDDKSRDNSANLVKQLNNSKIKLMYKGKNEGKGSAIKEGVKHAAKDYIGFMDADLPYSLENIGAMINELKNYDIAVGSRKAKGAKIESPPLWYRYILGKMFRGLRDFVFNLNVKDTQSGLKFFRAEVMKDIFNKQQIKGFGFDIEILYIARKKKYTIKEVPVHLLKEHSFKKSKLNPFKDSMKMFYDLFLIKANDFMGRYK